MRVLFVYPNITGHESMHQGILSLSSYLKKHGHITSLIDFTFGQSPAILLHQATAFEPDLVAFTATSGMYSAAVEFSRDIKRKLKIPIVFGGIHATIRPKEVIREELCIDFPSLLAGYNT